MKKLNLAQKKQDDIFRKMSAEKKLELVSQFWELSKNLANTDETSHRSKRTSRQNS